MVDGAVAEGSGGDERATAAARPDVAEAGSAPPSSRTASSALPTEGLSELVGACAEAAAATAGLGPAPSWPGLAASSRSLETSACTLAASSFSLLSLAFSISG